MIKHKVCKWELIELDADSKGYEICTSSGKIVTEKEWEDLDAKFCPYCGGEVKIINNESHYGETK